MKYAIVYLIKGEAGRYHKRAVHDVGKKFGVKTTINQRIPSHITFKYLSNRKKIEDIEELLEKMRKDIHPSKFVLEGIGNFRRDVLHFKIKPNRPIILFREKLFKELKKLKDIHWYSFDKNSSKFHVTIAEKDIEDKFDEIKRYLSKYYKKFNLKFDNITIIKKPKDKWIIYKRFEIK